MQHYAGVEGTGHHFYMSLVQALSGNPRSRGALLTPHTIWYNRWWGPHGIDLNAALFEKHEYSFKEWNVTSLLPGSYPHSQGGHELRRDWFHPSEVHLRTAAEKAGFELRIMVALRSPEAVLKSTCLYRHFEICPQQAESLRSNAIFLASELRRLPRHMYRCFTHGDLNGFLEAFYWSAGIDGDDDVAQASRNRVKYVANKVFSVSDHSVPVVSKKINKKKWPASQYSDGLVESLASAFEELEGACADPPRPSQLPEWKPQTPFCQERVWYDVWEDFPTLGVNKSYSNWFEEPYPEIRNVSEWKVFLKNHSMIGRHPRP